jgi:glycogen phosphorylase
VWLNNPQPPKEASGTSGQKAAINGVPNLSVLDGWWSEGYNGENGWAIEGNPHSDDSATAHSSIVCWKTKWCPCSINETLMMFPAAG